MDELTLKGISQFYAFVEEKAEITLFKHFIQQTNQSIDHFVILQIELNC